VRVLRKFLDCATDLAKAANCFGCSDETLEKALTFRTVKDSSKYGKDVATPLTLDQATYSRDALAKSTYDRLFSYIVKKINENIFFKENDSKRAVIGVLDIYGFEILQVRHGPPCIGRGARFARGPHTLRCLRASGGAVLGQLVRAVLHQLLQREAAAGLHRADAQAGAGGVPARGLSIAARPRRGPAPPCSGPGC